MKGLQEYGSLQKQSHRGWVWNRIVERLGKPAKDCVVLYLRGPEDLDRSFALKHGFKDINLFPVDIKRFAGTLDVDIKHLLTAWDKSNPIDVLYFDSCSTVGTCVSALSSCEITHTIARSGVIAVNMQRGRENDELGRIILMACETVKQQWDGQPIGKHRGRMLYQVTVEQNRNLLLAAHPGVPIIGQVLAKMHWEECLPCFTSYRNPGGVFMDSVVMRNPFIYYDWPPGWEPRTESDAKCIAKAKRKIAAHKAVRTMRRKRCERI